METGAQRAPPVVNIIVHSLNKKLYYYTKLWTPDSSRPAGPSGRLVYLLFWQAVVRSGTTLPY
jgi:hypothetical protein